VIVMVSLTKPVELAVHAQEEEGCNVLTVNSSGSPSKKRQCAKICQNFSDC